MFTEILTYVGVGFAMVIGYRYGLVALAGFVETLSKGKK